MSVPMIDTHDDDLLDAILAQIAEATTDANEDAAALSAVEPTLVPTGLAQATRTMRALARIRQQQAANEAAARAEMDRIAAWLSTTDDRLNRQATFLVFLLSTYHANALDRDPKAKTISTPYGALKARHVNASAKLADESLLMPFPDAAGFVEQRPRLKWGELKKAVVVAGDRALLDGEPVPGVTVEPAHTEYSVKPEVQ